MDHGDYRIELFVYPDGTEVEIVVFDEAGEGAGAACLARQVPAHPAAPEAEAASAAGPGPAPGPPAGPASAASGDAPPAAPASDPYICPLCESTLVYPADWDRASDTTWTIALRCPNCETWREITLERAGVEELNRELYLGLQALAREAERMTRRNFEEEAARLVEALARDLILPMDF